MSQPDWWVFLAELTEWVHWPAWAAFLTFAALINTARLADRGRHDERQKSAAFLVGTAVLLETSISAARHAYTDMTSGRPATEAFSGVSQTSEMLKMPEQLQKLAVTDFPNPNSLALFMAGTVKFNTLDLVVTRLAAGEGEAEADARKLRKLVCDVQDICLGLVKEAEHYTGRSVTYAKADFLSRE